MLPIEVIDHPKVKLAASLLGISRAALYGYLSILYSSSACQSPPRFDSPLELEAAAEWDGACGNLADALVRSRLADTLDDGAICLCDWKRYHADNLARAVASSVSTTSSDGVADLASTARAVIYRWIPDINPLTAPPAKVVSLLVALETSMDPDQARRFWISRLQRYWPNGDIPLEFRKVLNTAIKNIQGQSNIKRGTLRNPAQWVNAQLEKITHEI